jgi:AraC-like DNA-binding protein
MHESPLHVSFSNSQQPGSAFDLIRLEDLYQRSDLSHSPFQLHRVEFYLLILIEAGEGVHTVDFKEYQYRPGSVLTIRKDQIHRFHKNDTVKGTMLLFTDDFLVSYVEEREALKAFQLFNEVLSAPVVQLSPEERVKVQALTKRTSEEYFGQPDEYSLNIIRSELHILMARLLRVKARKIGLSPKSKYLSAFIKLQNLIEQHVSAHRSVKNYAAMLGMSTKTLNTITQSIIHKSAKAFIDDICTKQIKRLLINTEDSVKEIAFTLGFEETTNFYKYFKRQTGMTPEQFRST